MSNTTEIKPRTQQEILNKINEVKPRDFLGFKTGDLIGFLDYEHALPFLKEGTKSDEWAASPSDRESILAAMLEYMPFAWGKANNQRGISAGRSMCHYAIWVWMLGDEGEFPDLENYESYGKPHLIALCNHYGWNHAQWDDGKRSNG